MANIKSSKKRIKLSNNNYIINSKLKSRMKTQIKHCSDAIENNNKDKFLFLKKTVSFIDKMSSRKLLHKKTASRKISSLQTKFNNKL